MTQQKYQVIERLDAGGMAEVFKGKALSIQGIEKLVAIKRILPSLTKNPKFVAMFLDEARLSMHLNHANIVQVFDLGVSDNVYFIVMEYVDGVNLRKVLQVSNERNIRIPFEIGTYILIEVLKGLSHAHDKKDASGKPLNIVHRDISPPNILISISGEVKLVDFGLAKAITQLEMTDPGVIKGKFSYLSPEAVEGAQVDSRADIFSCGIILWELLANRRLFLGKNDYQTVELIRKLRIPPLSKFNPDVDAEFEAIVNRALIKDVSQRYQTAREFGDDLSGFLYSRKKKANSFDLQTFIDRLLGDKIMEERGVGASMISEIIQEEIVNFTSLDLGDIPKFDDGKKPLTDRDLTVAVPEDLTYPLIHDDDYDDLEDEKTIIDVPFHFRGDMIKDVDSLEDILEGRDQVSVPVTSAELPEGAPESSKKIYFIIGGAVVGLIVIGIILYFFSGLF
jgi:serine/threonine-protein kinase